MSRTTVLSDGRRFVAEGFTETFTFFSETLSDPPEGQIDPVTVETPIHVGVVGQLKFPSLVVSGVESAGQLVAVQTPVVKVAVGSTPNVREGHFARCTASTVDASLVGRKFLVTGWPQGGQTTSHRYPVSEAS